MPKLSKYSHKKDKKALLARKEKILQDISYYENRIKNFGSTVSSQAYFDEDCSSDSEDEFPTVISPGPSMVQLKMQQAMLKTCLHAMDELIRLSILSSSCNVMVTDPVLEREPPVTEPGLWREVAVECRFDLVPFNMTFYVHKPSRMFGPLSYRGLKVTMMKQAHEMELANSVLKRKRCPSHAIEVLRGYADEVRSRRNSLAKLSDKFADNLSMEPLAEGGYLLKCAGLMSLSWRLESKRSALGVFHHVMNLDMEYVEESYFKIISQLNKQICNPNLTTDERTLLLTKVVTTCLEARGLTQDVYESLESDLESVKTVEKRHNTEQEVKGPIAKKKREGNSKISGEHKKQTDKNRDEQIMAPPKSIPKKVKPKGKENMDENRKSVKRANVEEYHNNVKKAKNDNNVDNGVRLSVNDQIEVEDDKNKKNKAKYDQNKAKIVDTEENKVKNGAIKKVVDKELPKAAIKNTDVIKSKNKQALSTKTVIDPNKETIKDQNDKKINNADPIQEQTKKKVATKQPRSQKADKIVAGSKNDPATKAMVEKMPSKVKLALENDSKTKEVDAQKVAKDTKIVSSKTDTKDNAKKTSNSKVVGTQKISKTENPIQTDKPTTNKNHILSTNKLEVTDKVPKNQQTTLKTKGHENNLKKIMEVTKIIKKSATENKKSENTNIKSVITEESNVEKELDVNKKTNINKQSNVQNVKSVAISETKEKNDNPSTKKEQTQPKNKPEGAKKVVNTKNNEQNPDNQPAKNIDAQNNKEKKLKAATNPKNSGKNLVKTKIKKIENTTDKQNVVNNKNSASIKNTDLNSKDKGDAKVVKNVATKNKKYIADRLHIKSVAHIKNSVQKFSDKKPKNVKNKIVVKNLSHRNSSGQNKSLNIDKKNKASNTVKNVKTGNTVKENVDATKTSKIPHIKRFSPMAASSFQRNSLRVSPRTFPSMFKSVSDTNIMKHKLIQKPITGIPRLMNKAVRKVK